MNNISTIASETTTKTRNARMGSLKLALVAGCLSVFGFGCSSPKQIKEAIEKDPSIVFAAIEKDPRGFFETIEKARDLAQKQMADDVWKKPLNPKIDETRIFEGPKSAKVTIVEYADFLCGHCAAANLTMKEVLKKYPGDVRLLYKNKPILHEVSGIGARYFTAIGMQSPEAALKFKDLVFSNQKNLIETVKNPKKKPEDYLKSLAKQAGADIAKLEKDLEDPKVAALVEEDSKEADDLEFQGTPGFVVGGIPVRGAGSVDTFSAIIDRHLGAKK